MEQRERMMHDLQLARYSDATREAYVSSVGELAKYYWCCPSILERDHLRRWVEHLRKCPIGPARVLVHLAALKFFYTKTMGKPDLVSFITLPSNTSKLPEVLSPEEVERLLNGLTSAKYRVFFTTMYATGLRLSEACRLQTSDINAARGVILIRGKGNKERLVTLKPRLYGILRAYWKQERPAKPWLFPVRGGHGPMPPAAARLALNKAAQQAGLDKHITPHILRHSFATHLLENGTELRVIQLLLGHAHIETTTRYTRVSRKLIAEAPSPLDQLPKNDG
jgi:integrase/recombinase XerD